MPRKITKKNTRRPTKTKAKRSRSKTKRSFYTLKEDCTILKHLNKKNKDQTLSSIAQKAAKEIGRTVESVRDRIKRYLSSMSKSDQKMLHKNMKSYPNRYVTFFISKNGKRSIDGFAQVSNKTKKVKKTQTKVVKKAKTYEWV